MKPGRLPLVARYTWALHWPAAMLEGTALGILGISTFVAKRSLGAEEAVVALLVAFWQVLWIFAPAVGHLLERAHPQRLFRRLAVVAFLPVALVGFVDVEPLPGQPGLGTGNLALFVGLLFVHHMAGVAFVPHRGALVRSNYPLAVRGRFWGFLTMAAFAGQALAAKLGGWLLDNDPRWLRVLYPCAAIAGGAGYWLLGRIRWRRQGRPLLRAIGDGPWAAMKRAGREAVRILRTDVAFRTYEIGFMLYGFGFLASIVLLVLYIEGPMGLSYNQYTWAQVVAFPVGQILAAPLFGRLADRIGVERATAASFLALAVFFVCMPYVDTALVLVVAFGLFEAAMAGVNVGWNLGPIRFAPDGKAHMYAAVHFSMVGIRSALAPFLGFLVKEHFSFPVAFRMSAALVVVGALTLWRLGGRR